MTAGGFPVRGVHSILVTPFRVSQAIDEEGIGRVVDFAIGAGVQGIVALGVLGEADRLSDYERDVVIAAALEAASGRVELTIGVSHPATSIIVERAKAAEKAGATAVMVAPTSTAPGEIDAVQRSIGIPLIIQDYPDTTGVHLPVEFLASFPKAIVKLEDPPTAHKIALLRAAAPELPILAGRGGTLLFQDLAAGADGVMTGFSFPELLVAIVAAHWRGDRDQAEALYAQALPLLVFEGQPQISVALRKEILVRRGVIAAATVRSPAPTLDPRTLSALDRLLSSHQTIAAGV
jgi:4-hydroxy-tetrahydrodipicolinate synthase